MKHMNRIVGVVTLLMVGLATGCASTSRLTTDPMPESLRYSEEVSFKETMSVPFTATVKDAEDAEEIITFALSLSARGRHQHAAEFLAEAARRFKSSGRQLEVALLAGAANEYLKAGDMDGFRETVRLMRQTATKYQYAAFDEPMAALISLGDIASGGTEPSEITPSNLKSLYSVKSTPHK